MWCRPRHAFPFILLAAFVGRAQGQPVDLDLAQQVNRPRESREARDGIACTLIVRRNGPAASLYIQTSPVTGSLDIGYLTFSDGLVMPVTARTWSSGEYIVDVPAGYGPRHTRSKLTLNWYSNRIPRSRTWTLRPFPPPTRLLARPSRAAGVRAFHTTYGAQAAIEVWIDGPPRRARAILTPPIALTYERSSEMVRDDETRPARLAGPRGGNWFVFTPPFAADQDALALSGERATESQTSGMLVVRNARIATKGGDGFLVVPAPVVSVIPSIATITIPAQWSKIALLARRGRTGHSALLTCDLRWLDKGSAFRRKAEFAYKGPSLAPFGLEDVHLTTQPLPITKLPAQPRPLRLGNLPSFAFAFKVIASKSQNRWSAVVPIERQAGSVKSVSRIRSR